MDFSFAKLFSEIFARAFRKKNAKTKFLHSLKYGNTPILKIASNRSVGSQFSLIDQKTGDCLTFICTSPDVWTTIGTPKVVCRNLSGAQLGSELVRISAEKNHDLMLLDPAGLVSFREDCTGKDLQKKLRRI